MKECSALSYGAAKTGECTQTTESAARLLISTVMISLGELFLKKCAVSAAPAQRCGVT